MARQAARHAVRAVGVTKTYGSGHATAQALRGVDVDFESGEFTAIMGPSGSGKSTLMHVLAGLETVTSGQVFLGGTELTALPDRALTELRRERIGFVFQSFNLLPVITAEENVTLPFRLAGKTPDRGFYEEIINKLGLTSRMHHLPHELSGGQQQRVAVARALLPRPDVIFADEPTGNLDSQSGTEVLSLLRRSVHEMGQTVIMVTHDPVAASYADRVVLFADGERSGEIDCPTTESVLAARRDLSDPATPMGAR
ncbi:ABC transporter ATP-binding protein [Hoyosella altamirensis]|uniref:Putative ABC transport system ATP-binding protein n=1 Tax=Hoyosella altamirensis TaxID=616997 RepID=A0A839RHN7_9ACTN|nr:ABC transporter ATP-binding protein [Hoyosella altamirensis]MBB3035897.1 putative ABC transport system ATP-binding protein [Hoyosella altamirensis]